MGVELPQPFLVCGLYAILFGVMIESNLFTNTILKLFQENPDSLGEYGRDWMNWHAIACFYIGFTNIAAHYWTQFKLGKQIAFLTSALYIVWGAQNISAIVTGSEQHDSYTHFAWINVGLCLILGVWAGLFAANL
eukprot:c11951_g1_i4.p1 GENE.c11951_g1_i4~~c11951_g1_i4.p1  ORF type:complete len:135 (-),score=18.00 c11951_g1_i4:807-1211(-)